MKGVDLASVRRFHVYTDVVLVSLGWLAAYLLRSALNEPLGKDINSFENYLHALPLIVIPWIASGWVFGIYRPTRMRTLVDQFQTLLRGGLLGLLVISSVSFFFRELDFGRSVVLLSAVINLFLQGVSRVVYHRIERRMQQSEQ